MRLSQRSQSGMRRFLVTFSRSKVVLGNEKGATLHLGTSSGSKASPPHPSPLPPPGGEGETGGLGGDLFRAGAPLASGAAKTFSKQ